MHPVTVGVDIAKGKFDTARLGADGKYKPGRVRTAHLNPCLDTTRTLIFRQLPRWDYCASSANASECVGIANGARCAPYNSVNVMPAWMPE